MVELRRVGDNALYCGNSVRNHDGSTCRETAITTESLRFSQVFLRIFTQSHLPYGQRVGVEAT